MLHPDTYVQLAIVRHQERLADAEAHHLVRRSSLRRRNARPADALRRLVSRILSVAPAPAARSAAAPPSAMISTPRRPAQHEPSRNHLASDTDPESELAAQVVT